jgi:phosphoribosyl 1,2-cyclic phosphate phosphodiesterase
MNIRLLGTGGADGIPGLFSNNRVSAYARKHGGKDLRTRSAALVDGQLKIDLPPDTLCQLQRERLDAADWSAIVFTHSHEDHFAVSEIQYAMYPFTEQEQLPFSILGNPTIGRILTDRYPEWPIEFVEMHAFSSYCHASYKVTPVLAKHQIDEECLNLIIQRDGKTLLYATDTGVWSEQTFNFLADYRLDCLVIECTEGFNPSAYDGHLDLNELRDVLARLRTTNTVHGKTRVVTTHHADTGNATHEELQKELATMDAEPGYDGMLIEF